MTTVSPSLLVSAQPVNITLSLQDEFAAKQVNFEINHMFKR